jgi:DNA repair exonuclease SbcCD ATPase subunit
VIKTKKVFAVLSILAICSVLLLSSASAGFFDDLQKEAEEQAGEVQKEVEKQAQEWQKEAEKQAGEVQKEVEKQAQEWQKEAEKQVEETWKGIEKEIPKYQEQIGKTQEEIKETIKQAEETWKQMPEEERNKIIEAVKKEGDIVMPCPVVYVYNPEEGKPTGPTTTFMRISLSEGTISVYEPTEREESTFFTDITLKIVTGGKAGVDNVEALELTKTGENEYKTKIKAKGRILGIIPVEVNYEAEINTETEEIKDAKRPWWNVLVIG